MAGSKNRHGRPQGPISKPHKQTGLIAPRSKDPVTGINPEMFKPRAMSGGEGDSDRVRQIRGFYSKLPEGLLFYQEIVEEVEFDFSLDRRRQIVSQTVPNDRTFIVDNVYFFATPLFGTGLIPPGSVEGAVQTYFQIGNVVPVEISTTRLQPGMLSENRAYFPFLNDRVGPREATFSLYAKRGQNLTAYYINRAFTPIPLRTVGVRIEGWMIDSNAFEEILEQQR